MLAGLFFGDAAANTLITLYGIKNCDTVKKARQWLDQHEVDYTFHDVRADGLERETVAAWLDELGWEKLVNRRSTSWKALDHLHPGQHGCGRSAVSYHGAAYLDQAAAAGYRSRALYRLFRCKLPVNFQQTHPLNSKDHA